MTIINIIYICNGCNQRFSSIRSLEKHYLHCILYNYKNLSSYRHINIDYIRSIINILFEFDENNIQNENLLLIDVLNSNIFKNNNLHNLYLIIEKMNIEYIKYNSLMNIISKYFSISSDELNLLIKCYKQCKKNLINIF